MKRSNRILKLLSSLTMLSITANAQSITVETWQSLPTNPSVLNVYQEGIAKRGPDLSTTLSVVSLSNLSVGTGVRLRGNLSPTQSGNYTFYTSGSNSVSLWLSTDDSRFNKVLIASQQDASNIREWTKYMSQKSAPISLNANTTYYIEAVVMCSKNGGHVELGWKKPSASTIEDIPITTLTPVAINPLDTNDNSLPDSWELATGLDQLVLPRAKSEYGDPDNDGISNFKEYRLNTNPQSKESILDGLTLDRWGDIQGGDVSSLTSARTRFLSYPNSISHVSGVNLNLSPSMDGKNYGARYRGFLIAPVTGTYRLSIAGDDNAELWFADGSVKDPTTGNALTNRFGKQRLAHTANPGGNYSKNHQDFDLLPSQRSGAVHLMQGEAYYIEVLHKNESPSGCHVSLAWEKPGSARTIIPADVFESDLPEDSDADMDWLPDSWESAVGLNSSDSGIISVKDGQYGDFDSDGLTNLAEFQAGTNPINADSDNDGIKDGDEINYYNTDPLSSDAIPTTLQSTVNLQSYGANSFPWATNTDGSITAYDRRGWIEWPVVISPGEQGIYEIQLVSSISPSSYSVPVSFHIDGMQVDKRTHLVKTTPQYNNPIKFITPYLSAGSHVLRIYNHNLRADYLLTLHSLKLFRLGGNDVNSNGIPDWVELRSKECNQLTNVPTESYTSPAYVEGLTTMPSALTLDYNFSGGLSQALEPEYGVDDSFYGLVPLNQDYPTQLNASFNGGDQTSSTEISWLATNILELRMLSIRKGDRLLLTAHEVGQTPSGTFTVHNNATGPLLPSGEQDANHPVIAIFDESGVFTITATWTPENGIAQTSEITITVRDANFGEPYIIQTYNRRNWEIAGMRGLTIESDAELFWFETTIEGSNTRKFLVNSYDAGEYRVAARCPVTGNILATGKISAFALWRAGSSYDAQVVETRVDGSQVIRFSIVAENLPSNIEIRFNLKYQGSVFTNGSRNWTLTSSDFSSNGIASVLVETSSDPPQLCHSMHAFLVN